MAYQSPCRALKHVSGCVVVFFPGTLMHVYEFLLPLCTVTDSAWPLDVPPPLRRTPAPGKARNPTAPHPTSSRNRLFCVPGHSRYSGAAAGGRAELTWLVLLWARSAEHVTDVIPAPEKPQCHCFCSWSLIRKRA